MRATYFTERRELGALNIGGAGTITVEGKSYELNNLDVLYIGRGNKEVTFASKDKSAPAVFYLLSYPAHAEYPTALVRKEDASPTELGSLETCNKRTIFKYIHLQGARSCQLVMGVTHLAPGSNWNTMPPHTHMRRSEIYMYFNVANDARVMHFMGPPAETRHLLMADKEHRHLSWLVDSFRRRNARLQLLLGHGRRKPGLRRHGSRPGREPALAHGPKER